MTLYLLSTAALVVLGSLIVLPSESASWRSRIRRRPRSGTAHSTEGSAEIDAASLADLMAAMLEAGLGIEAGLQRISSCVPGAAPLARVQRSLTTGASWEHSTEHVSEYPALAAFCAQLGFAHATGAPSASMLRSAADQIRAEQKREAERRAAELGVKMMLPLGACFLPAFILLGVIPVIISMLAETLDF